MADILSTISTAITLASKLKTLGDRVREAEFQILLADLQIELAEVKAQVAGLLNENTDLKQQVRALQASDGEPCPRCHKRTWQLSATKPHVHFGHSGVSVRTYTCSECGFTEDRIHDSARGSGEMRPRPNRP
jgi:hypothetical protein